MSPATIRWRPSRQKRLDYGMHLEPLELWGAPENVLTTGAIHNEIVRSLAARHEGMQFVDQARLMAGSPRYFMTGAISRPPAPRSSWSICS
jgi:hypothetical protein